MNNRVVVEHQHLLLNRDNAGHGEFSLVGSNRADPNFEVSPHGSTGADADRSLVADSDIPLLPHRSTGADADRPFVAASNFLDITVFAKHAHLSSDERLLVMAAELDSIHWDVIFFSETRTPSGDYLIDGNYRLILHFDNDGCSGTAILVHARHVDNVKTIHRLSNRLLTIDLRIGSRVFRFVAVYTPLIGYSFDELHIVYDELYSHSR